MPDLDYLEDLEAEDLLSENYEDFIVIRLKEYQKKVIKNKADEDVLEVLRKKFVNDFPIQKLKNISKEEYVVYEGKKNTFCYRIENELVKLGNMHGSNAIKFGLYFGKKGNDTTKKYRFSSKFGESPDEAIDNIRRALFELLIAGTNGDLEGIRECPFGPMYRGKILSVYYPEKYLCIFVSEHLTYFMQNLGISAGVNEDVLIQQKKLMDWMHSRPECNGWRTHEFANFLYDTFGRPFAEAKDKQKEQDQKDKEYPTEFVSKIPIKISEWKEMLSNPEIFKESDIELLKRFYKADNHATTCYDLGIEDGVSPTSYIKPVVALAQRVMKETGLPWIVGKDGKTVWWRVLFWGRPLENKHFEWKLQPKLAKAMAALYDDLNDHAGEDIEKREDQILVDKVGQAKISSNDEGFKYTGQPKEKQIPVYIEGHKTYPRDRQMAMHALAHAGYVCEVDKMHPTFIRRNSDKNYTEPHHLIPMSCSEMFDVSLDIEENIVSLCSNCHNEIHYGKDAAKLIKKLYWERKADLEKVGIYISSEKLLSAYGIEE